MAGSVGESGEKGRNDSVSTNQKLAAKRSRGRPPKKGENQQEKEGLRKFPLLGNLNSENAMECGKKEEEFLNGKKDENKDGGYTEEDKVDDEVTDEADGVSEANNKSELPAQVTSRASSETHQPDSEQQTKAREDWERWLRKSVMRKECECGKLRIEVEEVKRRLNRLENVMSTLLEDNEQKEKQTEKLERELSKEKEAARKARMEGREFHKEMERMLDELSKINQRNERKMEGMRNQISMLRAELDICINKDKRQKSNAESQTITKEKKRIEQKETAMVMK